MDAVTSDNHVAGVNGAVLRVRRNMVLVMFQMDHPFVCQDSVLKLQVVVEHLDNCFTIDEELRISSSKAPSQASYVMSCHPSRAWLLVESTYEACMYVPVFQLFRKSDGFLIIPHLSIKQAHTGGVVRVARQFMDLLVTAKLVENAQPARQQTKTCAELGCDDGVSFEKNVLDAEFLEHVGQRQPRNAASDNDYLQAHFARAKRRTIIKPVNVNMNVNERNGGEKNGCDRLYLIATDLRFGGWDDIQKPLSHVGRGWVSDIQYGVGNCSRRIRSMSAPGDPATERVRRRYGRGGEKSTAGSFWYPCRKPDTPAPEAAKHQHDMT